MSRLRMVIVVVLILLATGVLFGQRFREEFRYFGFRPPDNVPPSSEFVFARWAYSDGSDGWSHDYPAAEQHINQLIKDATSIAVEKMSYRIVPMDSDDIFKYPFGYISEPGMAILTDDEVKNFREFVDRGGFVMLDDFDGSRQFAIMQQNIRRVFPDREMFLMTDAHPVLNTYYPIDSLYVESPYNVGADAVFYGVNNDKGELAVIICANNDLGDFWEWLDQPRYPLKPSAEGVKLGINFVLYSMTH
jgi:hypothetical protein